MAQPSEQDKAGHEWAAGMRRYGLSKLLKLMFMYSSLCIVTNIMYELQHRLDNDVKLKNISIMAMDPGGMPGTGISRE